MYEAKAVKLTWDEVSELITKQVTEILGRDVVCKANIDDSDYWAIQLSEERIPVSELFKLMETVGADEAARKDTLPESAVKEFSSREIGMGTAELLLGRQLNIKWDAFHIESDSLWLLDVKEVGHDEA